MRPQKTPTNDVEFEPAENAHQGKRAEAHGHLTFLCTKSAQQIHNNLLKDGNSFLLITHSSCSKFSFLFGLCLISVENMLFWGLLKKIMSVAFEASDIHTKNSFFTVNFVLKSLCICLSFCLSVCLSVCLTVCVCVCFHLPACLCFVSKSIQSVYFCDCLSVCLPVYLPLCLFLDLAYVFLFLSR